MPPSYQYSPDSHSPASDRYQDPPYSSLDEALGPSSTMASDGRYLYHPPPGSQPMPQYEYPSYPASDYDSAQMPQQPPRPMRHAQPPHPHAQPSYPPQPAPSPYQTPYGAPPANYPAPPHPQHQHHPPPVQPQWAGEGWPQYQQPQQFASAPPPVQQDPSFASGPGRPDAAPNTSPDARAYPPPAPPARNVRSAGSTPQPQGKPRGRESSQPTSRMPPTQAGFDFHKLLESYRLVIHESQVLSAEPLPAQTRSPPQETVERMWQSAQYGLQMLEATLHQATVQSSPAEPSPPIERPPTGAPEMPREGPPAPGVVPKPRKDAPVAEGQMCLGCNATSTPEWRRGPMGPRTLCNACGLVYAKLIKKRTREAARGRGGGSGRGRAGGQHGFGEDAGGGSDGEGGSEDDDSFGSQDRQSDAGVGRE
ncbi:hypothetical protein NEOLEDRAFT_1203914 [Neolentinus lepideus HHB14362 ss-1]|uniref:GATA-type domain-containing protein n=1 Tax=Neolentinus lepideus HHB14362 ss-1 TaxID=1314782 RepID=A0A165SGS6_9AGAM|nr:hypothetical protein NEOLEDRAFT_1203914 [Neolentinus lepideus HHB14362 ss-1]